jgi:hypothetical protein
MLPNLVGSYRGGDYLYGGLSSFGANLASGIQDWRKRQNAVDQFDGQLELMRGMTTTNDKGEQVPILDDKTYERYKAISGQQKAALGGEVMGALRIAHSIAQDRTVPFQVGDKTYQIKPSEAAQLGVQQSGKTSVTVGGRTIEGVSPGTAATVELAKQPKALTAEQVYQQGRDVQKDMQARIDKAPETKFQQEYKIPPSAVLQPSVVNPSAQQYRLFYKPDPNKPDTQEVAPEYDKYGIARVPEWIRNQTKSGQPAPYSWQNQSDVFRETKIEQTDPKTKAKVVQHIIDPEGELVNIGGQRIPNSEVQGIRNRHDIVLQQARDAIKNGKDPKAVQAFYSGLGYDPRELVQ